MVFDGESLIVPGSILSTYAESSPRNLEVDFEQGQAELALILTIAHQRFERGNNPADTINQLSRDLHVIRHKVGRDAWQDLIPIAQGHPVSSFILQDPFSRWSFEKPRGYSGDAHLLDFIYRHEQVRDEVSASSALGQALYEVSSNALSSTAVRERRDILTRYVDEIAVERGGDVEVLTVASGHLREADGSIALREGLIKRWVALDQDPLSIGSITRDFAGRRVDAIDGSLRGVLNDLYALGQFDFVYSAGLYDYLSRAVSIKLTRKCVKMLKPNGVFLFANFSDELSDDGYMETFMNWQLLLRSEADMWNIIDASVDRNRVEAKVEFGENRNVVYGIIRKRD